MGIRSSPFTMVMSLTFGCITLASFAAAAQADIASVPVITPSTPVDTDFDGYPDSLELSAATDMFDPYDPPAIDTDGDGLMDFIEVNIHRTNPADMDSDHDGLTDGYEVNMTDSPLIPTGLNPNHPDTDGDGLSDRREINSFPPLDPCESDTDQDGIPDGVEIRVGTNPLDGSEDNKAHPPHLIPE